MVRTSTTTLDSIDLRDLITLYTKYNISTCISSKSVPSATTSPSFCSIITVCGHEFCHITCLFLFAYVDHSSLICRCSPDRCTTLNDTLSARAPMHAVLSLNIWFPWAEKWCEDQIKISLLALSISSSPSLLPCGYQLASKLCIALVAIALGSFIHSFIYTLRSLGIRYRCAPGAIVDSSRHKRTLA